MQTHFPAENIMSVERKYIDVPLSAITSSTLPVSRQSQPVQEMGTRLLELAKAGDAEGVRDLMNCGAPFSTDWLGTSPLHFAAQFNHLETVEMLLKAGISRDARNKVERTPLHVAAQEGHVEVVRLLINYGADIDCKDMLKMTPLHWGAEKGHEQVVRLLLDYGADPLISNKFDKTPSDIAHDNSRMDIVSMLQDAGMLDPVTRKVLRNQGLLNVIDNNLQQNQTTNQQNTSLTQPTVLLGENDSKSSFQLQTNNELQNATATLQMLQEHGITMLPVDDDSSIITSAVKSGQTVVLTEAGKMALNLTKVNMPSPVPKSIGISTTGTGSGMVKKFPVKVGGNSISPQKIFIDGRKLIRVQPEELINMTREKKVIIHTGDKKLGRPGQIIFSKPIRQIVNLTKTTDLQNKRVTSSQIANLTCKKPFEVVNCVETKRIRNSKEYEEIAKQLEEARREAEMYKEQLMLKEKEAEQYKLQLQSLVNGDDSNK